MESDEEVSGGVKKPLTAAFLNSAPLTGIATTGLLRDCTTAVQLMREAVGEEATGLQQPVEDFTRIEITDDTSVVPRRSGRVT